MSSEPTKLIHELVNAEHLYAVDRFRGSVSVLLSSESEKAPNGDLGLTVAQCSLDQSNLATHSVQVRGAAATTQKKSRAVDRYRAGP